MPLPFECQNGSHLPLAQALLASDAEVHFGKFKNLEYRLPLYLDGNLVSHEMQ
jgi:hypothetical protein